MRKIAHSCFNRVEPLLWYVPPLPPAVVQRLPPVAIELRTHAGRHRAVVEPEGLALRESRLSEVQQTLAAREAFIVASMTDSDLDELAVSTPSSLVRLRTGGYRTVTNAPSRVRGTSARRRCDTR